MSTSGVNMPPEWFETTSAPPAFGIDSRPRTSARKYRLMIGPTQLAICRVNPGSHLAVSGLAAPLLPMPRSVPSFNPPESEYGIFEKREYHIRWLEG
jgi:hypothetical protein